MTHISNMPHILEHGITHYRSPNSNPHYITIGDKSLIDNRDSKEIPVCDGDFSLLDTTRIILGNFIPFYFGVRMPMLYVIQNGGNFVEHATPAEDIVYLACSLTRVLETDTDYYFSDGHATDKFTIFYSRRKIKELPDIIDWIAVTTAYWGGQENLNLKRKKQAEFLVGNDLLPDVISGIGCYNDTAKSRLIQCGVDKNIIKIIPKAYY